MIDSQDFRTRTLDLRRSARAQVLDMRRARIEKRNAASHAAAEAKMPTVASQPVPAMSVSHRRPEDGMADADPQDVPAGVASPQQERSETSSGHDPVQSAAMAEIMEDVESAAEPSIQVEPEENGVSSADEGIDPGGLVESAGQSAVQEEVTSGLVEEAEMGPETSETIESSKDEADPEDIDVAGAPVREPMSEIAVADDPEETAAVEVSPGSGVAGMQTNDAVAEEHAQTDPMAAGYDAGTAARNHDDDIPFNDLEPVEAETEAASDLSRLPGAGPGLIWMLNKCGIFTLSDLAGADPQALSLKLGVVGQILDMQRWIDFAKDIDSTTAAAEEEKV